MKTEKQQLNTGGRPQLDPAGKVEPLSLRLTPTLLSRLKRIRGKQTWPQTMEGLADKWEGKQPSTEGTTQP